MTYQLHHGDCLEIMPGMESASVDAIICDPPYGTTACKWDVVIPLEQLWEQYKRLLKPRGAVVLFGNDPFTSVLILSNPEWYRYKWIWEKTRNSNPYLANQQPLRCTEEICVFSLNGHVYNPQMEPGKPYKINKHSGGRIADEVKSNNLSFNGKISEGRYPRNIIKIANPSAEMGLHPTQKPTALLEYLVLTYTNPGDTVLDNAFGSCTTGEACLRTGRNFIGIEMMEEYYNIGKARMERVERELSGAVDDLPIFARTQANGQVF